MEHIGIKIKALRKGLNMTQSELAGTELTKSMLSQIENNVSSPSMKTLHYLAGRLNKPVAYFLEDQGFASSAGGSPEEAANEKTEARMTSISRLIDMSELEQAQKEIDAVMEEDNPGKSSKTFADIVYKFGSALVKNNRLDEGEKYLRLSIAIYEKNGFYVDAAKAHTDIGRKLFQEFRYEECLDIIRNALKIYSKAIVRDIYFEIEMRYYQTLVLTSLENNDEALEVLQAALKLSTESGIYYKADELYRIHAIINFLRGEKEQYDMNVCKALKFAEFSGNKTNMANIHLLLSVEASESGNADKALEHIEIYREYSGRELYIYYLQKAKVYFLMGKYDAAYDNISRVDFPDYIRHKLDYLILWSSKVYEGLILSKLGRHGEAIAAIKAGIEKLGRFGDTRYMADALKAMSEVYSEMKDFENAFTALKKADEIRSSLQNSGRNI